MTLGLQAPPCPAYAMSLPHGNTGRIRPDDKCGLCGFVGGSAEESHSHAATHDLFKCDCRGFCGPPAAVIDHINACHISPEKCTCGFVGGSNEEFRSHMASTHLSFKLCPHGPMASTVCRQCVVNGVCQLCSTGTTGKGRNRLV